MSDENSNAKKRILIVDDDAEYLEMLRLFLETDFQVATVDSGHFAVDFVKENDTDLILMDLVMPDMDGFETFKTLRQTSEGRTVPVVFITGKSSRNTVLECINLGVDGYIVKPVSKEELLSKVNEIISLRSNGQDKKTILAVDDDISYLKIIRNSLKDQFNVIMVKDVSMAIDYLKNHVPDVIILDYNLPLLNNEGLVSIIRKNSAFDKTPIITILGIDDKKPDLEPSAKSDKFLIKPVSKLDLVTTISSVLSDKGVDIG